MSKSPLWLRILKRNKEAVLRHESLNTPPSMNTSFHLDLKNVEYSNSPAIHASLDNTGHYKLSTSQSSDHTLLISSVTAAAVAAAVYSPHANASIVSDLVDAITKAISNPLQNLTKVFSDTFGGMMDKGNQEQIVSVSKGIDSMNEMVKYAYNQKLFAESQPDPNHCEAEERAVQSKAAQSHVEDKKTEIETEMSNSNVRTSNQVPSMSSKTSWISDFLASTNNGKVTFKNVSPSVLKGQSALPNASVSPSTPAAQTHTPESAKIAQNYILAIRTPIDEKQENIDVDLLERGDARETQKLAEVTSKKARTAVLMQPFTDELAERTPIPSVGGKSKRELMHEGVHNTYYSEDYNKQLSELSGATPALVAIAKSLSYSNMLAFESLQKIQQQNQLIAVVGIESMELNHRVKEKGGMLS
jgi:hypothetical protein